MWGGGGVEAEGGRYINVLAPSVFQSPGAV